VENSVMTDFDEFEQRLAAAIRSDADASVGPSDTERIARAAVAETGTRATRAGRRSSRPIGRLGRGRGVTLLAAAALVLVGGALLGSGALRRPSITPPTPAPTSAALVTASPDGTTTPSASASPSLDLTWTNLPFDGELGNLSADGDLGDHPPRIAWLGDRFVLADVESGAVRISTDGEDWEALSGDAAKGYVDLLRGSFATWEDRAVGWWNPEEGPQDGPEIAGTPPITGRDVVQVVSPPAAPSSTTPFKGRIESIGIGPRGIVAQVHSHLDWDAWVTEKLGLRTNNDWTCCVEDVTFEDGVLEIKLDGRPGLKVVWADEGLAPGDYQDRGFGWHTADGERWTAMAPNADPTGESGSSLPTGTFGSVVGVSDGFIATGTSPDGTCPDPEGSCTGMWYSPDGLTWRHLGTTDDMRPSGESLCIRDECHELPGGLTSWQGGALAIDGEGHPTVWTSSGPAELEMAARMPGTVATGPLGIVSIGGGQALVSRDGIGHKIGPLPARMADASGDEGRSTFIAVGDRTVLALVRERTGDFTVAHSLWLGTFEP
jgi:hypothetical protein